MIIDNNALKMAKVVCRHVVPGTLTVIAKVDEDGDCLRLRLLRMPPDESLNLVVPGDAIRECNTLADLQMQVTDAAKEARFRARLATALEP